MYKFLFLILGWVCFGLGAIGIILPGLPTTPFILVSLWAFSKSSRKLHQWLLSHPNFGQTLQNWEQGQIIPRKAKYTALLMISLSSLYLVMFSNINRYAVGIAVMAMLAALTYIFSRPSDVATPNKIAV